MGDNLRDVYMSINEFKRWINRENLFFWGFRWGSLRIRGKMIVGDYYNFGVIPASSGKYAFYAEDDGRRCIGILTIDGIVISGKMTTWNPSESDLIELYRLLGGSDV